MSRMTAPTLAERGIATALACWAENARGSAEARLVRHPGVAVAVFPSEPEREFFNNAVLAAGLPAAAAAEAIGIMRDEYAAAGISEYAAWVLPGEDAMADELLSHGYRLNETTLAMGLDLDELTVGASEVEVVRDDWAEYVRILDVPGFLPQADPSAYFTVVGRLDAENVGSAMAFDHDGDCGIYNVGTEDRARRHGVGTAMTARLLLDARDRGCRTATLQSTPIGEGVYARLGFRSLGTIREFVPA
jgi:GNAT superfamily N-acetyltransferase